MFYIGRNTKASCVKGLDSKDTKLGVNNRSPLWWLSWFEREDWDGRIQCKITLLFWQFYGLSYLIRWFWTFLFFLFGSSKVTFLYVYFLNTLPSTYAVLANFWPEKMEFESYKPDKKNVWQKCVSCQYFYVLFFFAQLFFFPAIEFKNNIYFNKRPSAICQVFS